jgi:hypothetical protein
VKLKNPAIDVLSDGNIRYKWLDDDGSLKFNIIKTTQGQVISEEIIDIYSFYTQTDPTINVESDTYLLFSGIINEGKIIDKFNEDTIELKCSDRNYVILNKIGIPQAFKAADSFTSPKIIQRIIQNADNSQSNVYGFDSSGNRRLGYPFLVDARLFSDGIKTSDTTTTSASTRKLINTGDTFITDGINEKDWVRNTSTNEYAFIVSVDSETQLTLDKDIFTKTTEGYEISDGFIQDTRPDGTAFPDISFNNIDKPIPESISNLSQTNNTNTTTEIDNNTLVVTRGMRWYMDTKSRFHWYSLSNTPEYIIQYGTNTPISPDTLSHKLIDENLNNSTYGNVNLIIFKAGEDMNGEMIRHYARARFSGDPETKDSFRPFVHVARQMKDEDLKDGNITKNQFDDYNYPAAYPMTPSWDRNEQSVANDTEYNTNFIVEAKLRGRDLCDFIFQKMANPRWKGNLQLRGEDIPIGSLIQYTNKKKGINNIKVRVLTSTHSRTTKQGWITSLGVEEDELEAT